MNEFAYWNENYEYQPSTTRTAVLMLAKLCQNGTCFLTFAGGLARKQNFRGCTLGNSESFKGWNFFCYVLDMCGVLSNHSSPCKPPSQDLFVPVWPQWRKHTEFVFFGESLSVAFPLSSFLSTAPAMTPVEALQCHYNSFTVASPRSRFPTKQKTGLIGMIIFVPAVELQSSLNGRRAGAWYK